MRPSPYFYLCFLLLVFVAGGQAAASPLVALLKSSANARSYQSQNIGSFEEDWQSFKRTLESANLRFEVISDNDLQVAKLAPFKAVILPLLVDLPEDGAANLEQYAASGGRVIVTDGGGMPTPAAGAACGLAGAAVTGHRNMQDQQRLSWAGSLQDFAVGTLVAEANVAEGGSAKAIWVDAAGTALGPAIVKRSGNLYLGWAPGIQGETTTNASLLLRALEDAVPGISKLSATQLTDKDFQKHEQELEQLAARAEAALETAKQAGLSVPLRAIQRRLESAQAHARAFYTSYSQGRSQDADAELATARTEFSLALAQSMPVRKVEARSIWLDRGTIVACQNPGGLQSLFDRLKRAGINVIYFETNNAGFTMYPSQVSRQNPQTKDWDPLGTAVEEAHKRGMELHAWCWTFSVGNTFHNPIIKEDPDYPGPVLASHDLTWALASARGCLVPPKQHEFWLDPSSTPCRHFVKELLLEVANRYDVDGIQLDYIRYPFNGKGGEMGFNWTGRLNFESSTHLCLDRLDDRCRRAWQDWKVEKVSSFVKEVSEALRSARPGIRISAAVYATPRAQRLASIQQDWETWVKNGWVDTLNPMTYVTGGQELDTMAGFVQGESGDRALVYPGLMIKDLDTAGLVEQLDVSRSIGTMGNTMFAVAQLDDKKAGLLQMGPYRSPPLMTPQSDPVRAATLIFDDFAHAVGRYTQDPDRPIVSERAMTNEVLSQIDSIQQALHSLQGQASYDQLVTLSGEITNLKSTIRQWLKVESFIQRGPRAQYISSCISQAGALLSYAAHKSKLQNSGGAEARKTSTLPATSR